MGYKIYTVSELNQKIKSFLEDAFPSQIYVEGEVTDYKKSSSGHIYFTVTDERSRLSCVMWRFKAAHMPPVMEKGTYVIIRGRLNAYAPGGNYSLAADMVEVAGEGLKKIKLQQLKKKLAAEGIFDEKKKLPFLPSVVGVVTAENGAAFRDIVKVLKRRNPYADIILTPCAVQGTEAPAAIAGAIELQNRHGMAEVLIVGRGGGGSEDLSAFDDERVVRAVAASHIPVVSAVGHEIDYSLTDLAADMRAETPSSAAEKIMKNLSALEEILGETLERLKKALRMAWKNERSRLDGAASRIYRQEPGTLLREMKKRLRDNIGDLFKASDIIFQTEEEALKGQYNILSSISRAYMESLWGGSGVVKKTLRYLAPDPSGERARLASLWDRLGKAWENDSEKRKSRFAMAVSRLEDNSPLGILGKGYALVRKDGSVAGSLEGLSAGDTVDLLFCDGEASAEIYGVRKFPEGGIDEYLRRKDEET